MTLRFSWIRVWQGAHHPGRLSLKLAGPARDAWTDLTTYHLWLHMPLRWKWKRATSYALRVVKA